MKTCKLLHFITHIPINSAQDITGTMGFFPQAESAINDYLADDFEVKHLFTSSDSSSFSGNTHSLYISHLTVYMEKEL